MWRSTSRSRVVSWSSSGSKGAPGVADDVEVGAELGAQAGEEEAVVVDEEEPGPRGGAHDAGTGTRSCTSVPAPGVLDTTAVPPTRWMRPRIDSAMPCRSEGTAVGSKPRPWSRT